MLSGKDRLAAHATAAKGICDVHLALMEGGRAGVGKRERREALVQLCGEQDSTKDSLLRGTKKVTRGVDADPWRMEPTSLDWVELPTKSPGIAFVLSALSYSRW